MVTGAAPPPLPSPVATAVKPAPVAPEALAGAPSPAPRPPPSRPPAGPPAAPPAAPPAKPDSDLEARIATIETAAKTMPPAAAPTDAASSDPAASQKIADLTNQFAQLKATITQATQAQASTGADISKRLDDAEKKLNEPGKDTAVAR
ncbi:MAG TPA: hypothetical protein VNP03_27270, partial [Pseudonocardia sp.]|nr:hypothetical protein [Pseudonocardia sp.]